MKHLGLVVMFAVCVFACGELATQTTARLDGGNDASSADVGNDEGRPPLEGDVNAVGPTDSGSRDPEADSEGLTPSPCLLSASDYDRSCNVDSDCTGEWFGNVCTTIAEYDTPTSLYCFSCAPNGAIRASAIAAYEDAAAKAFDAAPPVPNPSPCFCPPPSGSVCCNQGICTYVEGVDGTAMPCGTAGSWVGCAQCRTRTPAFCRRRTSLAIGRAACARDSDA